MSAFSHGVILSGAADSSTADARNIDPNARVKVADHEFTFVQVDLEFY